MTERLRVLVADDHAMMRRGVRFALEGDGLAVVAEAATGPEATAAAERMRPDLCLVDFFMPGGGVELISELHRLLPDIPIVVLTVSSSDDDLFAALAAGASGFLPKATDAAALPRLLRGAAAGEAPLPSRLTAKLIKEFRRRRRRQSFSGPLAPDTSRFAGSLTERQLEVLELMAAGRATSQIAADLRISDVTVRRHISAIVGRTGAGNRSAAVRLLDDDRRSE